MPLRTPPLIHQLYHRWRQIDLINCLLTLFLDVFEHPILLLIIGIIFEGSTATLLLRCAAPATFTKYLL